MWARALQGVGLLLTVIGLGGILDDIRGWRSAVNWLSSHLPIGCDFGGNCGRWIIFLTGLSLIALGWFRRLRLTERRHMADLLYPAPPLYKRLWWKLTFQTEASIADKAFDKRMLKERISIRDAAKMFYDAARAGKISGAEASEQMSGWNVGPSTGSQEDILHWWASHISKELPVYGRRPPSSLLEQIHERELKDFVFSDEATKLRDPIHDGVYYTDLAVNREAFEELYDFEASFHGAH